MSENYLSSNIRKLKSTCSEGNIYSILLDIESSDSAISTSRAIHESSSEVQSFDSNRESESEELKPPQTQPLTEEKLSISTIDTRYISYYQEKQALHKLFSAHCREYFNDICALVQDKFILDNSISSLKVSNQPIQHDRGSRSDYIQKLSQLNSQEIDIDKELAKFTKEFNFYYVDTYKAVQNEQKAFSSLIELHANIEKLHDDLLKSKVDSKRLYGSQLNKINKLSEKVDKLTEEYNKTQEGHSKLNTSNSILQNKSDHTDINEESGMSELELINQDLEIARGKLANCQYYESILIKGISSVKEQLMQNSSLYLDSYSEIVQDTICRDESETSTVKSYKDSSESEMLYEKKHTDLKTEEISFASEIIQPSFEELTDSKRIKQYMDELQSLVFHREKVTITQILQENKNNPQLWLTQTVQQHELINITQKIQDIQKLMRTIMLVYP